MFDIHAARRAFGDPPVQGRLRAEPQDFQVIEIPAFVPSGEGEHAILTVRKANKTTQQVAKILAQHAGVPQSKVSWAGLKDRRAVTEQRFSVHLVNQASPDWRVLNSDELEILEITRHRKKLRPGVLRGNRFLIRVTDIQGDLDALRHRGEVVLEKGVPNYFGEQRFGFRGGNIAKARMMFRDGKRRIKRHERSLYLSAARSLVFNAVLSRRVEAGTWDKRLAGDIFQINGSQSQFADDASAELDVRLRDFDIHPTGPLWGQGVVPSQTDCQRLELSVAQDHEELTQGLAGSGSRHDRRALRVEPQDFQMQLEKDSVLFSFELPPGAYATAVIREIIDIT